MPSLYLVNLESALSMMTIIILLGKFGYKHFLCISSQENDVLILILFYISSYRAWMVPDTEAEEEEFIRGAGFEDDVLKNDNSTISFRKLLDETKDFIDR
jgi:hypothetical protein